MCIIAFSQTGTRLSHDRLKQLWDTNPQGAGLAWADKGSTHWVKGLMKFKAFADAYKQIPSGAPYLIHCRIATVGGQNAELTHPFVTSLTSPLTPTGKSSKHGVMAHNGHWSQWDDRLLHSTEGGAFTIPNGPMSDSRAIAILMARHGVAYAQFCQHQRIVHLAPNGVMTAYGDWKTLPGERDLYYSNLQWNRGQSCNPLDTGRPSYTSLAAFEPREHEYDDPYADQYAEVEDNTPDAPADDDDPARTDGLKTALAESSPVNRVKMLRERVDAIVKAHPATKRSPYLTRETEAVQETLRYMGRDGWQKKA